MKWIAFILFFLSSIQCIGQRGYAKDSLQFKAYIHTTYEESFVKSIVVKKVFCDFCNKNELEYLKQRFWDMTNADKYHPALRIKNGVRKTTLITRVSKKDFEELKND